MVDGPDDVVGLLAYALYKQTIAEDASRGNLPATAQRDPGERAVALYRSSAAQKLSDFAASVVEEAREGLQQSAVLEKLAEVEAGVKNHVSDRTSFGSSLWTNFLGWLLTVAVTFFVLLGVALSGIGESLLDRLESTIERSVTPPQARQ